MQLKVINPERGTKYTPEKLALLTLDDIKKMIIEQVPNAFNSKAKKVATKKSAVTVATKASPIKKSTTKKSATKKTSVKKTSTKKNSSKKTVKKK